MPNINMHLKGIYAEGELAEAATIKSPLIVRPEGGRRVQREPYTIRIFVPDGDPEGAKIVTLMNLTGVGIAFPRAGWPRLGARPEFKRSGIYILTGPAETAVANPGKTAGQAPSENREDARDTVIVPAQQEGFERVFLGQHCWFAIRIGGGMLSKIKYIAAYQSNPISAITTYAKVDRIEPYGDEGKYKLVFAEPAKPLPRQIPFADATTGSMQGPRYTSLTKLLAAKRVPDLFT